MAHASGYPLQGRLTFQGLKVSIENRKGSYREDKAHTPPQWRTKMCCHYGYVRGSEGVDGDHVDVFIGPNPHASMAYIVRQVRPDDGVFDEQKVMLGFDSARDAKEMYLRHYDTPKFFGGMKAMPMEEFARKVMGTLHGDKLVKAHRAFVPGEDCPHCSASLERGDDGNCNSCGKAWPLEKSLSGAFARFCKSLDVLAKSRVEGHFRATHGGKQVWVEAYNDNRVLHQRPASEQAPRAGDSLLLFPEIGHVRPLREAPRPKAATQANNQLAMEFKSLEASPSPTHSADLGGDLGGSLGGYPPSPEETLVYARPGLKESVAAAAMLCALKQACAPAEVVELAAQRRAQSETVAAMFYDGLVSDANLAAIQAAAGLSPQMFRVVLSRLRDELRNAVTPPNEPLLPLAPLDQSAPAQAEIPL